MGVESEGTVPSGESVGHDPSLVHDPPSPSGKIIPSLVSLARTLSSVGPPTNQEQIRAAIEIISATLAGGAPAIIQWVAHKV